MVGIFSMDLYPQNIEITILVDTPIANPGVNAELTCLQKSKTHFISENFGGKILG